MKSTVQLEAKDIRPIIARFLGLPIEDVIPQRYGFAVAGMKAEEIERRIAENE